MIQYDKDGATLFYTDAQGNRLAAGVFDGRKYSDMLTVMDAQISAARENAHAVDLYTTSLQNAQGNVNAGRPVDAPPKPLQHLVSDAGVSTYVPFNPPLPDLAPLNVTAPSSGTIAVPTVDTQTIMYAMITAIYRKMFPAS